MCRNWIQSVLWNGATKSRAAFQVSAHNREEGFTWYSHESPETMILLVRHLLIVIVFFFCNVMFLDA